MSLLIRNCLNNRHIALLLLASHKDNLKTALSSMGHLHACLKRRSSPRQKSADEDIFATSHRQNLRVRGKFRTQ